MATIEELAVHLADTDARCRSNTHRIDELAKDQKALTELTTSVKVLATEQGAMKTDIGEIKTNLKTLTDKSGKHWDGLIDKVIWLVVGALLSFALAQVGI